MELLGIIPDWGTMIGTLGTFLVLSRRIDQQNVHIQVLDEKFKLMLERLSVK